MHHGFFYLKKPYINATLGNIIASNSFERINSLRENPTWT